MSRFKDRLFLISGGARGLGGAQASRIVAEGGRVVIGDVLSDEGGRLASSLGASCTYVRLDVTSEESWNAAVAAAERIGPLNGLVNGAGIFEAKSLMETDVAMFERHTQVNQLGTFLGMRAVVPALGRAGGGSIVNISSSAGLRGSVNTIAYAATKWAVRGMTKVAALELAPQNIRVNSVHPGPIDTDMLRVRGEEENAKRTERVPLKRFGTAEEIAGLVLFLLSDESRYMTGSEVTMDGGVSL